MNGLRFVSGCPNETVIDRKSVLKGLDPVVGAGSVLGCCVCQKKK